MIILNRVPHDRKRITFLIASAVLFGVVSLILPEKKPELINIENIVLKNQDVNEKNSKNSMTYNYWDIPLVVFKDEFKPVIKKQIPPREVKATISSPPVIPILAPNIEPSVPSVKYLGHVLDVQGNINLFIEVEGENLVLAPNQIYNHTWQVLESTPIQLSIKYLPYNKIVTITK